MANRAPSRCNECMKSTECALVTVQLGWADWRLAQVPMEALRDVRWFQPAGAPRELLHANVPMSALIAAELIAANQREQLPEQLPVCILKRHTVPPIYGALASLADASRH